MNEVRGREQGVDGKDGLIAGGTSEDGADLGAVSGAGRGDEVVAGHGFRSAEQPHLLSGLGEGGRQ